MQSILSKGATLLLRSAAKPVIATPTNAFLISTKNGAPIASFRLFSTKLGAAPAAEEPEKSVFISQSADIHTNLALEDWLYRNFNFENHQVLLMWRNDPCVVIGRHQNPWAEVDVASAEENKISLARRNSGGGCVYHDRGNLNLTFFTPRGGYNRKKNLEVVCRALDRQFAINAEINPREDVTVNGHKVVCENMY